MYLLIRNAELERGETEIFHLLVHCSDIHNGWCWSRLKPGAWNTMWVLHVHSRDSRMWAVIHCLAWCIGRELSWKQNGDGLINMGLRC